MGEIFLWNVFPQVSLYPRYRFSPRYYYELPPNTQMVHRQGPKWKFTYTINELGYRGKAIPISDSYGKYNIVVLGDSYTFGMGVDDNFTFSQVLSNYLGDGYSVINLGVPGVGLTQEIRRFYEYGILYQPKTVVIVFCGSDPEDNLRFNVTRLENGTFRFFDIDEFGMPPSIIASFLFLSESIIQKSQLYNLIRIFMRKRFTSIDEEPQYYSQENEQTYIDLLLAFVRRLRERNIELIMLSVDNDLDRFPRIKQAFLAMAQSGQLDFISVSSLFRPEQKEFYSPEGHWGPRGHELIGRHLASFIKKRNKNKCP